MFTKRFRIISCNTSLGSKFHIKTVQRKKEYLLTLQMHNISFSHLRITVAYGFAKRPFGPYLIFREVIFNKEQYGKQIANYC